MLRSLYSGISGMKVNQTKLDVIGNNIANVGTTSFKSARVRFQDMLSQNISSALGPGTDLGGVNPRQVGLGAQIAGIDTLVSQGMMQPTGRNLDAAIDGEGYFVVAKGTPDGNLDPFYTRDGSFTLDKNGNLLTSDGYRVMGYAVSDGTATSIAWTGSDSTVAFVDSNAANLTPGTDEIPLVIPNKVGANNIKTFSIEKDGTIKAVLEGGKVAVLGKIAMASFKNPGGLEKQGKNLYKASENSGTAAFGENGEVLQGMLEMSNVDLAEQFTDMIVTSRAFQANSKTISTGDEILQDILNLKR